MKIELLYPDLTGLYGEFGNIAYLTKSVPDVDVVETNLDCKPRFLCGEDIDLVYMSAMSESSQKLIVEELLPYRDEIAISIEKGQFFFLTGNALEIFGSHIHDNDEESLDCLNIFPVHAERDLLQRYSALYVGKYSLKNVSTDNNSAINTGNPANNSSEIHFTEAPAVMPDTVSRTGAVAPLWNSINACNEIDIVGQKSQFTRGYYDKASVNARGLLPICDEVSPLFKTTRGPAFNNHTSGEGLRYRNFMATYLLGPILVMNPLFLRALCNEIGIGDITPAFEETAMEAYRTRLKEYNDPNISMNI